MSRIQRFFHNCLQARVYVPLLLTAAWTPGVLLLPHTFWLAAFSAAYLLLVPGYVVYRTIVGYPQRESRVLALSFVVGLSMIALMVLGLGVNQVLLWQHLTKQPLTATNLTVVIAAFTGLFTLATAWRRLPQRANGARRYATLTFWLQQDQTFWARMGAGTLLLLLPVLAIGGANMLSNGGSNWLAMSVVGLSGLLLLGLLWTHKKHWQSLYPLALYGVAAALLLGTSMRGWAITGHDVMQEFQVFQLTSAHSQWNMQYYQDAYTACLSITILPTILQRLTGIYDPYIFKLVFQLVFALIAPLLYTSLRTKVPRKLAFITALVFLTFPTFLTDMMMLNRQETAMLCFALALTAGITLQLKPWQRHALMIIFFGGMALAHYSTSYVTISVLLVTTLLGVGVKLVGRMKRLQQVHFFGQSPFGIVPPYIVVLVLLMVIGWSGLATNTAGNISQTLTTIGTDISHLVSHTPLPPKPGHTVDPHATDLENYETSIKETRRLPAKEYYADAIVADFKPAEVPQSPTDVAPWFRALHIPAATLGSMYDGARQAYIGLLAVLLAIGLLVMTLKRRASTLPTQYTLLGVGSLIVVVLQVVLPSDAVNYGLARIIQQGLVVLSLPAALGFLWLLGVLRLRKFRIKQLARFRVAAVAMVMMLFLLSSFFSTLTGGYKPTLAFSNAGFYYEAYYTHSDEIEADQWLVNNTPKGSRVYADEFARRQMITYAGIFPEPTLLPVAIPVDSYVYVSHGNTTFNEVPVYYRGSLLFYTVPTYFLNAHKSLLYNAGRVLIYK